MRGEERCVAVGATRSEGGKGSVQHYSYTTTFGWVFPRTKARRQGVIDAVWLRDFGRDIKTLQTEIRRQTAFVYKDENLNQDDNLQRDCHCECCAAAMNCKNRVSAPEMTIGSRMSVNSCADTRDLELGDVICRKLTNNEGNLGVCYSGHRPAKVKVPESKYEGDSSGSEKSVALDSVFDTYAVGAKCDEYNSMQSDISRDSGIYSTDDSSLVSEVQGDKSLLQEIGDVLGDQEASLEPCIHCGSLPLEDIVPASKEDASCPVWLTRFSTGNDLLAKWESQEWEVGHSPLSCISPVTRKPCLSEDSNGYVTPPAAVSDEEGPKEKLCMAWEKLHEKSSLNKPSLQEISELAKFTHSFQSLNTRIEDLRSGLECLVGEVNESKRDFISLEKRTTKLLASTAASRNRLTRVRALQLLEDRLQEEWWAAYDPASVSFHENYIV